MFISEQKVYQLELSEASQVFINSIKERRANRHTLVFFKETTSNEDQDLLLKILSAVNLTQEQYILVDKSKHSELKLHHFISEGFKIAYLLSFGITANSIGLNINQKLYSGIEIDTLKILCSDDLQKLQQQTNLKKALWNNLKQLYQVE